MEQSTTVEEQNLGSGLGRGDGDLTRTSLLDRSIGDLPAVRWETVAWGVLILVAVITRIYDVGTRAMSHDESLHAVYSLDLYRSGSYQHNPMMHGPLLFHINAFFYMLFGVSDATTRLGPALAGIGVVAMPWFFRRWLGTLGALLTAFLLLISPSLLFHSRYIRNDIYIALFSMIWVLGLFRFVEEKRIRWLGVMVGGMAFAFITKENAFMNGAIIGAFAAGVALWRWIREDESLFNSVFADLAVLMLTLILPFVTPGLYLVGEKVLGWQRVEWNGFAPTSETITIFAVLVTLITGVSVAVAYFWYGRRPAGGGERVSGITFSIWGALMLSFWAIEVLFFTTFFTNPLNGLATGIVGSLGYWIAQQEVQRGSQPWYYYILMTVLYEFLPLLLTMGGAAALLRGIRSKGWDPLVGALSDEHRDVRRYVILFLSWWVLAAWLAYSYAGERMPWLTTHMAQPMAIFGGWWLAYMIERIDWSRVRRSGVWGILFLTPVLIFSLATIIASMPLGGRDLESVGATLRAFLGLALAGGALYLAYRWIRSSDWATGLRLATLGFVTILTLLTIRFSYMLTYVNFDMATEYLVYAHGGPDVKRAVEELELISQRTVGGRQVQVAYDDDVAWPMSWYLRFYPNNIYYGANPSTDSMSVPVIFVGNKNYDKVEPYVARDYVSRDYRMIWWPEESYKGEWNAEAGAFTGLTPGEVVEALTSRESLGRLWQIWFYRNHPDRDITEWPHRHEMRMYVRRDIANIVWDLNVTPVDSVAAQGPTFDYPEIDLSASTALTGPFEGVSLVAPRSLAVGEDGRRYILDTGNNRVVILEQDGTLVRTFGTTCFLSDGESGGCIDPDGSGPRELGDGQFREPWGIAVATDGRIFVSDTWNGRIQSFDSEGNFLGKWGIFNIIDGDNRDPFSLFGPRGLAITPSGSLLVADTGNKRIVEYSLDGQFLNQVGGGGIVLGRFEEPVDVAVDPASGSVFVADLWNRRIQKLSPQLAPLEEWPVPTWESRDIWDKAFLAVDADGALYASDPQFSQVFVFSPEGTVESSFGKFGTELNRLARPTGLAVDPLTGELLVADADNNRVLLFPSPR